MFDRRAEAEMRLYSEKLAKELALTRHRQEGSDNNTDTQTPPPADEGNAQGIGAPDTELKPL